LKFTTCAPSSSPATSSVPRTGSTGEAGDPSVQFRYAGPHAGLISPRRLDGIGLSGGTDVHRIRGHALEADPQMSEQTSRVPLAQLGKFWRQGWQGWRGIATAVVRQDEDHAGPGGPCGRSCGGVERARQADQSSLVRTDRVPKAKARPPERLAIRARLADNDAEQRLESFPRQAHGLWRWSSQEETSR
jgi:hypothetical protein